MIRIIPLAASLISLLAVGIAGERPQSVRSIDPGFSHILSPNTSHQIQAILDSISAEKIHRYLDTMVAFHFRHTLDDTVSQTTGMGAARRWVYRKFQEFIPASGGRLQVQYFDFVATICGVTQLHRNVLAILPGTVTPNRHFIVSGHLDTRGDPVGACTRGIFSPGANDDASGTAISIELARVMSRYQFESSLIFMAVVGEDQGLFGSAAYASWAQSTGMRIDGMITNDVVGNIVGENNITDSMSTRHFSSIADATPHRQMARYMKLKSEFFYPIFTVNLIPNVDRPGRGGDHQSFQNNGYTAVRFVEPNENLANQHTATDIVENMSPPYTARVARVNAVGLASLASAPEKPGAPTILDPGTGTSLIVQWTVTNTEPDLAGFRIAVRDSGGLFYTQIVDAGNATRDTITGLTSGVGVYVGMSAYDTDGNESMFSTEAFARPAVVPSAPANASSTSLSTTVRLSWSPNPQLDVTKYRIYRSTSRTSGFVLYDSVAVPNAEYIDGSVAPHVLYFYHVRAVDADGNESTPSATVTGQRVTHDLGILVVDGTKDGAGTPIAPTDSAVDAYYLRLIDGFRYGGEWDVADSLLASISISDAEMAPYSTVLWHSDVRSSAFIYPDTSHIRKYLQQGGRFILSGWKLSAVLKAGGGVGTTIFPAGTFVPQFLKIDSTLSNTPLSQDFIRAVAVPSAYPDLVVDSVKIPTYGGTLVNTDAVLLPYASGSVQTLYTHRGKNPGSPLEGRPVAWAYVGSDAKIVVFDFPLFYMRESPTRSALHTALIALGELPLNVGDDDGEVPAEFVLLQNYPNPFNPTTEIRYSVPVKSLVTVAVYDLLGREVRRLVNDERHAGTHSVQWDGKNNDGLQVASGIFFYRLVGTPLDQGSSFVAVRKMIYLK